MTAATTLKPTAGTIWRNGSIAAVVSAVINVALFLVGSAIGGMPPEVLTPMGVPIQLSAVLLLSVVPVLLGTLLYWILNRFVSNPNLWFGIAVIIAFLVMLPGPLGLAGAPILQVVLLEVMHVVSAAAAYFFLVRSKA